LKNSLLYPGPRALPAFSLEGADGQAVESSTLIGHWNLIFVGFTHCPDICPTTLATLGELEKQLPELDPPLQIVFVSVDPERDSAQRATEYARYFSANAIGVTADHRRLEPFTRSLGMVYMQTPLAGGDYTVDHSSRIAIINPDGKQVGVITPPFVVADMADDLRFLAGR
jgi:protein SCO1/2